MWWMRAHRRAVLFTNHYEMRIAFIDHWWSRLRGCPYRFNYDLTTAITNDSVSGQEALMATFLDLQMDGHSVMDWLEDNARGRIHMVVEMRDDLVQRAVVHLPSSTAALDLPTTFSVGFSDKKLALMWKMVWGGKMVDGRGVRLSLSA